MGLDDTRSVGGGLADRQGPDDTRSVGGGLADRQPKVV